ncbi:phage tail assembly chaperone [Sphingomonas sp.]|uniref:phage tail assembly chaperone n=1 Tax=Sphingomonas sp. TaxID=28214 RepID=UPI003F6EAEE4
MPPRCGVGGTNRRGGNEAGSGDGDQLIPYRQLMGVAMDAFHWSPDQFWNATPHELWAMVEARQEAVKAVSAR